MNRLHGSLLAFLTVALLIAGGCSEQIQDPISSSDATTSLSKQQDTPGMQRAREAKSRHAKRLMQNDEIVGTAVGLGEDGAPVVVVFTVRELGRQIVPAELDGVPVRERVTGRIVAFQANPQVKPSKPGNPSVSIDPKSWFPRPVPIGVSTSNITDVCAAGTIGCRVKIGNAYYLLSNNHVLAKERTSSGTGSSEAIVQPGRYDDGCAVNSQNAIATLSKWIGIQPTGNLVDAALAILDGNTLLNSTPSNGYGTPGTGFVANPALGTYVLKYGRTTGQTRGRITEIDASIRVQYSGFIAEFDEQIVISTVKGGSFSRAGDSGSLIVLDDTPYTPVGLLFAGSSRVTIANMISNVLAAFPNSSIE